LRALFHIFYRTKNDMTKIIIARTACNLTLCPQVRSIAIDNGSLEVIGQGTKLDDTEASLHCSMAALSAALEPQFRMKFVVNTSAGDSPVDGSGSGGPPIALPSSSQKPSASTTAAGSGAAAVMAVATATAAVTENSSSASPSSSHINSGTEIFSSLITVSLESNEDAKILYCVKTIAILASYEKSRPYLQTALFASSVMKLIEKTSAPEILLWVSQILFFICFKYKDYPELLELGIQSTLKKLSVIENPIVVRSVASTILCFCSDNYCVNILASSEMIEILRQLIEIDQSSQIFHDISCILYYFTAHSLDSRCRVATAVAVELINIIGRDHLVSDPPPPPPPPPTVPL
jgi:hypothetical protein